MITSSTRIPPAEEGGDMLMDICAYAALGGTTAVIPSNTCHWELVKKPTGTTIVNPVVINAKSPLK
jgi:hypothetical protein